MCDRHRAALHLLQAALGRDDHSATGSVPVVREDWMSRLDPTAPPAQAEVPPRRQPTLLTIPQVAGWYGVTEAEVRAWIIEGSLPRVRTPAGSRVPVEAVPGYRP